MDLGLVGLMQSMKINVAEQESDERSPGQAGFLFNAAACGGVEMVQQGTSNRLGLVEIPFAIGLFSREVLLLNIPVHHASSLLFQL